MPEITEAEYDELASKELQALIVALDAFEDERIDTELSTDILSIEFWDDTRYVVNSHRAARQIWMAADRSAWHFDWKPEARAWIAAKNGEELWATLTKALQKKLGAKFALRRA
jgi:CyaY protein